MYLIKYIKWYSYGRVSNKFSMTSSDLGTWKKRRNFEWGTRTYFDIIFIRFTNFNYINLLLLNEGQKSKGHICGSTVIFAGP